MPEEGKQGEHDLPVNVVHKVDQHQDQQHPPLLPGEVRKLHLKSLKFAYPLVRDAWIRIPLPQINPLYARRLRIAH